MCPHNPRDSITPPPEVNQSSETEVIFCQKAIGYRHATNAALCVFCHGLSQSEKLSWVM